MIILCLSMTIMILVPYSFYSFYILSVIIKIIEYFKCLIVYKTFNQYRVNRHLTRNEPNY